jgi:hypothetical protein
MLPFYSLLQDASAGTTLFSSYIIPNNSNGVTSHTAATLEACVDACSASAACHFTEFRYNDNSGDYTPGCFLFSPTTAGDSSDLAIFYKLPPTLDVSASSVQAASISTPQPAAVAPAAASSSSGTVHAQSVSSGLYAKYSYAASVTLSFNSDSLQTVTSRAAAAAACGMVADCWGFVEVSAGSYALKAGNDLAGTRTVVNTKKTSESLTAASSSIVQPS